MSGIDHLLVWGIDPRDDGINFQDAIATQDHERFNLYSRRVALSDPGSLSLPGGVEGAGFVHATQNAEGGFFMSNDDGTVILPSATTNVGTAGSGDNLEIGDVTNDDAVQVFNNGLGSDEFVVFYLYR